VSREYDESIEWVKLCKFDIWWMFPTLLSHYYPLSRTLLYRSIRSYTRMQDRQLRFRKPKTDPLVPTDHLNYELKNGLEEFGWRRARSHSYGNRLKLRIQDAWDSTVHAIIWGRKRNLLRHPPHLRALWLHKDVRSLNFRLYVEDFVSSQSINTCVNYATDGKRCLTNGRCIAIFAAAIQE
jgi:hypothetical protein